MEDSGFVLGMNLTNVAAEIIPIDDLDLDTCKLLGPVALAVQVRTHLRLHFEVETPRES
jgi:hypothetical protein